MSLIGKIRGSLPGDTQFEGIKLNDYPYNMAVHYYDEDDIKIGHSIIIGQAE